MKSKVVDDTLYLFFYDDFDYHNIQMIKTEAIDRITHTKANHIVIDLKHISFIDSTGIGFILARYKQARVLDKTLLLANVSSQNRVILNMSGIFQIIECKISEVQA